MQITTYRLMEVYEATANQSIVIDYSLIYGLMVNTKFRQKHLLGIISCLLAYISVCLEVLVDIVM